MTWRDYGLPSVSHDLVRLEGGLDLVTPTLQLKPGVLRDSLNYEVSVNGGYSRIPGYERFDGRAKPADASVSGLVVSAVTGLAAGDTVNGQTSGATARVIGVSGLSVYLTLVTGTFQLGENLREGVSVVGTITALSSPITDARAAAVYQVAAADVYRASIAAVPGEGPVRGVAYYKNDVYAWRNNAGNTAMVMHKATPAGWVAVSLGYELVFDTGLPAGILAGDTVTDSGSGATGVVAKVVIQSGDFSSSDAAGRLILSSTTGAFVSGNFLRVGGTNRATARGVATAITLQPNGRVETDTGNLGGLGSTGTKLYGCDGVNRGFEFDGTTYVPIVTGMLVDAPTKVKVHSLHLFFAFGASLQFSGLGTPYIWSPLLGAGELALDDVCTNLVIQPGAQTTAALAVYVRNQTYVLYGTSAADWNLTTYSQDTGALAYSAQNVGKTFALDDRGVVDLQTSQAYGNFASATLTENIRPYLSTRRNRVTASGKNREKSQFRLFFSDGYGLYLTIVNGKFKGAMPVYFPNDVTCSCDGETPDGNETSFFGSSNGMVYRLDVGPNFDGAEIQAVGLLVYNSEGNSRINKHYRRGSIELTGNAYAEFMVGYNLEYGDATRVDQGSPLAYANNFSAPLWDAFTWDAFVWDGLNLSPSEVDIRGNARNIAVRFDCQSNFVESFTLNSLILHYTARRAVRG